MHILNQRYYAGSYQRISREDDLAAASSKNESLSISNQRELIRSFVESHPEIEIVREYADDGFSGVNFDRPDFLRMLEDINTGTINCVIVKDLSRFGRNYIEVGKYLEEIFPVLGVRFIAISDNYDSLHNNKGNEQLVFPFMNLVNDVYCRELSLKVRTSVEMKQKKGEFVGSFAPYGYRKNPDNIHHLVIDPKAAEVVRRIFDYTIAGVGNQKIADILNGEGIPSPADYKRLQGDNFVCHFQKNAKAKWAVLTIRKILANKAYIGTLEQGKTYSINHKVKKRLKRDPHDWHCVEDVHEPIIDMETFRIVQRLLEIDSRTAPGKETVYLFSGVLVCGKCGETMIRRKKTVKGKEYIYYGCYDRNKILRCENISIKENKLENAVLQTIKKHIDSAVRMTETLCEINKLPYQEREVRSIDAAIEENEKDIQKFKRLKMKVYEDYHDRFIGWNEYKDFEAIYSNKESEAIRKKEELETKKRQFLKGETQSQKWVENFIRHGNIESLNRTLLLMLVERIVVHSNTEIEILFQYRDEYKLTKAVVKDYLSIKNQERGENYG